MIIFDLNVGLVLPCAKLLAWLGSNGNFDLNERSILHIRSKVIGNPFFFLNKQVIGKLDGGWHEINHLWLHLTVIELKSY